MNKEMLLEKKKWLLGGIFVLLLLVVYMKLLLGPAVEWVRSSHSEVKETREKLARLQKARAQLPRLKAEITRLRQQTQDLEIRFPSRSELPELLEHLSEVAGRSDVKIIEISPAKTISTAQETKRDSSIYEELPIAITARSGYHELGSFINELENSERIFRVKDIRIKSDPQNQKRHHVKLVVETFARGQNGP